MTLGNTKNRRAFLKEAAVVGAGVPLAAYLPNQPSQAPVVTPAATSPFATNVDCNEGHELILQAIAANGVRKMFFCGGTDNFHFMESVAKFKAQGKPTPELITVMHESDALYMNMGYFQYTGRPQVTVLHVNCGTMNAGAAWQEAWHANSGIVVMAGRTPWTTKSELPGARSYYVHWQQEMYDQAEMIRQFVKWDYEIRTPENASLIVQSAFRIAATEPCGPVYIQLPREIMAAKLHSGIAYSPADFPPAISTQGDSAALPRGRQDAGPGPESRYSGAKHGAPSEGGRGTGRTCREVGDPCIFRRCLYEFPHATLGSIYAGHSASGRYSDHRSRCALGWHRPAQNHKNHFNGFRSCPSQAASLGISRSRPDCLRFVKIAPNSCSAGGRTHYDRTSKSICRAKECTTGCKKSV